MAGFVERTVQSMLAQTWPNWNAIVIDDGSTDDTADIVERVGDSRVRLVRQRNAGVSAARNRGLQDATGDAILFLDADDWLAPDALDRMVHRLAETGADAVYGPFCFMTEDGGTRVSTKAGPFPHGDIIERLLSENLFANGGHVLLRRSAADRVGGFRSDLKFGEDWEYWCRLAASGTIEVVPGREPILFVRQRSTGAYLRMADDLDSFTACTDAIFQNPVLAQRFSPDRLARLRRRGDAENLWIAGRESVRHGRRAIGRSRLRRSFARHPTLKRAVLVAAAHALTLLPTRLHGPFRRYRP